jgi:hypothetical protein
MSTFPSSLTKSSTAHTTAHLNLTAAICPSCEQPIPHDRFEEIKKKIETRERERSAEITATLETRFGREKTEALEQAQKEAAATLAKERELAAEREATARVEGRQIGEAAAQEMLAASERANQEAQVAMQARVEQAETARAAAEQSGTALKAQVDQMRRDTEAAIEKMEQDAAAKEDAIRIEARQAAETAVQQRLTDMERTRQESEAALLMRIKQAETARSVAQETSAALHDQLDQMRRDNEAVIDKMKQETAARESIVRQEAVTSAEAAMKEKLADFELAKIDAETKAATAEQQVLTLQETHEAQLFQRLQEQREALEQAQTEAINAEKSAAFEEKMKLSAKIEALQRTVDKNTAEELGEGAEIDLFDRLKTHFESDRIERIKGGQPGADILHVVIHNGKDCGKIIYDSKNHDAWRYDFVTKLAADQMAAKAEHAILSTRKFPAGERQLHVKDGVILASPSRVVALIQIVRQHLVQTHTLRLSNEARTQKTAALYGFITSERCTDLFARIDTHTDDLLEMQVKEKKGHELMWKRQGELLRSVQKVRAELRNEIDSIIGTAETYEQLISEKEAHHE